MKLKEYKRMLELELKAKNKGLIINKDKTFNNPIDLFLSKDEYLEWVNLVYNKFGKSGLPIELR